MSAYDCLDYSVYVDDLVFKYNSYIEIHSATSTWIGSTMYFEYDYSKTID